MIFGERRNTRSLDLCVPILSMTLGKINGVKMYTLEFELLHTRKLNSFGRLFGRLSLLYMYVGISWY